MESKMVVKVDKLNEDGNGIVNYENNIIEIEGVLPNEEIEIIITKKLKNKYLARVNRFIEKSIERENNCKLSGICGGCDFVNYTYQKQLEYKQKKINDLFSNYQDKVLSIKSNNPFNYRNKTIYCLKLNNQNNIIAGYYKKNSHELVNVKSCPLDNEEVSETLESIKDILNELHISIYNEKTKQGALKYLYTRINDKNHIMLGIVATKTSFTNKDKLIKEIIKRNKNIKTIVLNINDSNGNNILGKDNYVLYNDGFIIDSLMNKKIKISLPSFYQVNSKMVEELYDIIINESNLKKDDIVLDAYCGTGTIGLLIADYVKKVIGVEINSKAIEDTNYNKMINHQENITFVASDASKFILKEKENNSKYSLVIMDPPRSGCSKVFIDSILELKPDRLTYVSCNPLTLKRDLELLSSSYEIKKIIPVDMFPHTKHVETVTLLQRKDIDDRLKVRFDLDNVPLVKEETKATYQEIKDYIFNKYNVKVSTLNIAQTKTKYGIIERESYNKPKDEDSRQPKCTREKEDMIVDALKYFKML